MAWNVSGLSIETALGGEPLFENVDILLFMETWEYEGNALPRIKGFSCIGSIFNEKKTTRGRGFGGIAIYTKSHLQHTTSIEHADPNKQFMVVRLHTRGTPSFLIATYFAPLSMNVYKMGIASAHNPFHRLIQAIHDVSAIGEAWIVGDFNARVSHQQFIDGGDLGTLPPWLSCSEDLPWQRGL
jgi:hypothetical protein